VLFSSNPNDIDIAIDNLCKQIVTQQHPYNYKQENYAELAYLKRTFKLPLLNINDSIYLKQIFNNYYYDQYYLYSKFLNENAIVTEDCLHIDESTEKIHNARKLLFYALYPNSIKLPINIVDEIEEYATIDDFLGPYQMLNVIYYLKKYNYNNLSATQKEKLLTVETHLSKILYTKYIDNKPWNFYKLASLKVLKMNKNELVKNVDISFVVDYFKSNKPLGIVDEDVKNKETLVKIGSTNIIQQQAVALLWIFLLENK
jgi:hypothetical protein